MSVSRRKKARYSGKRTCRSRQRGSSNSSATVENIDIVLEDAVVPPTVDVDISNVADITPRKCYYNRMFAYH